MYTCRALRQPLRPPRAFLATPASSLLRPPRLPSMRYMRRTLMFACVLRSWNHRFFVFDLEGDRGGLTKKALSVCVVQSGAFPVGIAIVHTGRLLGTALTWLRQDKARDVSFPSLDLDVMFSTSPLWKIFKVGYSSDASHRTGERGEHVR